MTPKTLAFVTHTGNNGLLEAIHYRVPMVGLPIYMNQEDNLARLVEKDIAVGVSKWSDAEEIYQAITKVISNRRSAKFLITAISAYQLGESNPALWDCGTETPLQFHNVTKTSSPNMQQPNKQ